MLVEGETFRNVVAGGAGTRATLLDAGDGVSTKVAIQIALDASGALVLEMPYRNLSGGYTTVGTSAVAATGFVAGDWYVLDAGVNASTAWLDVTHFHSASVVVSAREVRSGSDAENGSAATVLRVSGAAGSYAGIPASTVSANARVQTVALGDGARGPFSSGSAAVAGLDPNDQGVDHYWPYAEAAGATVKDVVSQANLTYGGAHGTDWYWIGGRNPSWDFESGFPQGPTPVGDVIVDGGVLKLHRYGSSGIGTRRLSETNRIMGLWWDEVHVIVGTDTDEDDLYLNPAHPYAGFAAALRTDLGANQPPTRDLIAFSILHEGGGPKFQAQVDNGSTGVVGSRVPLVDPVANGPFHVRIVGLGTTVRVDYLRLRSSGTPLDQDWQGGFIFPGWTRAQLEGPRLGMNLSHKNPNPATQYSPGKYGYYDDFNARYVGLWSTTVTTANVAPVAAFAESCVNLDCTFTDASTDSDGAVVSWQWDFGDGATSTDQHPTHAYGSAGTYMVTLTVTDDDGAVANVSQSVTVNAANVAPVAAFAESCVDLDCTFTDASTDSDGAVVSWQWDFGDGATSTDQHPTHAYGSAGTYTVALTVTDDDGAVANVSQSVTVSAANVAPVAAFGESCVDLDCTFTDASTDSDGAVVSWQWDFGDGATSTDQHPTHVYGSAGTYTVTLTVTDDDGASANVSQSVTVSAANVAPVAAFGESCVDLDCTFTDASTDSDGAVVSWQWDFGDGATSTDQHPTHAYGSAGTYTVTLTVTDDDGAVANVSQSVTVSAANVAPVAAFGESCVDLDCTFTDASTDSDGAVVSWQWDFGDGATSTDQHPTHAYGSAGTYTVTLTVTDDDGAASNVSQSVTVSAANVAPVAAFTVRCSPQRCRFIDNSVDQDGTVVSWRWDFGDGSTSTSSQPQHTFTQPSTYNVVLSVQDDDGAVDSETQQVTCSLTKGKLRCR